MQVIVAVDRGWGIGSQGQLLARIPADMKFFKQATLNKTVVMGKETFRSLPGQEPLVNRTNIVLCEDPSCSRPGIIICRSLPELWERLRSADLEEVWVIGGASVYAQLLPYCRWAWVTKIDREFPADRFFPDLDQEPDWELVEEGSWQYHQDLAFCFTRYHNRACRDWVSHLQQ